MKTTFALRLPFLVLLLISCTIPDSKPDPMASGQETDWQYLDNGTACRVQETGQILVKSGTELSQL